MLNELGLGAATVVFLYVYPTLLVQLEVRFSVFPAFDSYFSMY